MFRLPPHLHIESRRGLGAGTVNIKKANRTPLKPPPIPTGTRCEHHHHHFPTIGQIANGAVAAVMLGLTACTTTSPYVQPGASLDNPAFTQRISDLPFNPLAQTDYPSTQLGTGRATISSAGCFLTSLTMAANQLHGTSITPEVANRIVKKNGGFAGSALDTPDALPALGLREILRQKVTNANRAGLQARLDLAVASHQPVIMGVDYQGGSSSGVSNADHFIIVFRQNGNEYHAVDPAGGNLIALQKTENGLTYKGRPGFRITEMLFVAKAPFAHPIS